MLIALLCCIDTQGEEFEIKETSDDKTESKETKQGHKAKKIVHPEIVLLRGVGNAPGINTILHSLILLLPAEMLLKLELTVVEWEHLIEVIRAYRDQLPNYSHMLLIASQKYYQTKNVTELAELMAFLPQMQMGNPAKEEKTLALLAANKESVRNNTPIQTASGSNNPAESKSLEPVEPTNATLKANAATQFNQQKALEIVLKFASEEQKRYLWQNFNRLGKTNKIIVTADEKITPYENVANKIQEELTKLLNASVEQNRLLQEVLLAIIAKKFHELDQQFPKKLVDPQPDEQTNVLQQQWQNVLAKIKEWIRLALKKTYQEQFPSEDFPDFSQWTQEEIAQILKNEDWALIDFIKLMGPFEKLIKKRPRVSTVAFEEKEQENGELVKVSTAEWLAHLSNAEFSYLELQKLLLFVAQLDFKPLKSHADKEVFEVYACPLLKFCLSCRMRTKQDLGAVYTFTEDPEGVMLLKRSLVDCYNDLTPLMHLALRGSVLLVRKLLAASANPHAVRAFNQVNALHCAVQTYDNPVVPILLAQDVAINALYKLGNQWFSFPLFEVVHTNDINTLKRLLECEEIIVNLQNANGSTALMRAAKHGFKECCVILLQKGARLNLVEQNGINAFHWLFNQSTNRDGPFYHTANFDSLEFVKIQDWMNA